MNALEFLATLRTRGVEFKLVDGQVYIRDRASPLTDDERGLICALRTTIRALLIQQLPDRRGEHACDDGFEAPAGAALCERCAFSLPDHFWRRSGDCVFFAGAATEATCRRCGVPRLEHLAGTSKTQAPS